MMQKKMKRSNLRKILCSDDSIVVLQNGRIENSEYIRELVRFSENCMEEDIVVVYYYSGHGGIDERGDNYFHAANTFDGNDMTCVYFDVLLLSI